MSSSNTLHLDHGSGRIRRLAPKLRLRLVDHGRTAVQIAHIDGGRTQSCRLPPSDSVISLMLRKARRIRACGSCTNALVAGSTPCMRATKTKSPALAPRLPCSLSLDGARRIERPHAVCRGRLRQAEAWRHGNCGEAEQSYTRRHFVLHQIVHFARTRGDEAREILPCGKCHSVRGRCERNFPSGPRPRRTFIL